MNEQKIQELLQRYFDGETSLSEEKELQRYFAQKDIPDSLLVYRPMFAFFAEEKSVDIPKREQSKKIHLSWWAISGIAAAGVALILFFGRPEPLNTYTYLVDGQRVYDESAMIEAAENKLQLMAASMQRAQAGIQTFEKLQEGTSALQQLNKMHETYRKAEQMVSNPKTITSE